MISIKLYLILLISLFLFADKISGQTCGFGCFGLGGFYAGYNIQNYSAEGLNSYLINLRNVDENINRPIGEFNQAVGFRLGANFFRTQYRGYLFTAKGYYQFLKEEKSVPEVINNEIVDRKFILNLDYWGLGFDIGHKIIPFVDWKIIDFSMNFNSAKFSDQKESIRLNEIVYENNKLNIGYSIGTGFVIRILQHYISIETTAGYKSFSFNQLYRVDEPLSYSNNDIKLIDSGGLFGVLQLNVGIPLY